MERINGMNKRVDRETTEWEEKGKFGKGFEQERQALQRENRKQ